MAAPPVRPQREPATGIESPQAGPPRQSTGLLFVLIGVVLLVILLFLWFGSSAIQTADPR
jgi:hypothetical protein